MLLLTEKPTGYRVSTRRNMQKSINLILFTGLILLGLQPMHVQAASDMQVDSARVLYYRYVDENGTRSTSSSIPPEYAQKGYEIVTRSGKIIKVPPAPDPEKVKEEEARLAKQRRQMAEYEILARRYSSVDDIYSARDRRLTHLNASIAILQSNIESIKRKIAEFTTKAADQERQGLTVHASLLTALEDTKSELAISEEKLRLRRLEHDEIHQRFEEDVKLFEKGKAFMEARRDELRRSRRDHLQY